MHARHAAAKMPTGGRHRQVPGVMFAAHGAWSPVSYMHREKVWHEMVGH